MSLTEDEELELIEIEQEQLRLKLQAQQQQQQPSVEEMYAQDQEVMDNQPYISPEMNAQIDAHLAQRRAAPPPPLDADVLAAPLTPPATQPEPSFWDPRPRNPTEFAAGAMSGPVGTYLSRGAKAATGFLQEHVGRPIAQGAYNAFDAIEQSPVGSGQSITGTRTEPLVRSVLSPIGGEEFGKPSQAGERALQKSAASIPGVGADQGGYGLEPLSPSPATASNLIQGAGQSIIPAALTGNLSEGVTKTVAARGVGPLLSKLIGYGTEGAVGGALEGLLMKSQDVLTSAGLGAVGDLAIRGAGGELLGAAKGALKKGKNWVLEGLVTPEARNAITDELVEVANQADIDRALATASPEPKTPAISKEWYPEVTAEKKLAGSGEVPLPAEAAAAEQAIATVKNPNELTPFSLVARVNSEGKPTVSVIELSRGQAPRVADLPIESAEEREAIFKYMMKHERPYVDMPREVYNDPRFDTFRNELNTHAMQMATIKAGPLAKAAGVASIDVPRSDVVRLMNEARVKFGESPLPVPQGEVTPLPKYKGRETGTLELPDPDVPDELPETGARVLSDEVGNLKLEPEAPAPPPAAGRNGGSPPPPKGPPPPAPPPPPPGPGQIPPVDLETMNGVKQSIDRMSRTPGMVKRFFDFFSAPHNRAELDVGNWLNSRPAQKALEKTSEKLEASMREFIPSRRYGEFGADFTKYAEGSADDAVLRQKYPEFWERLKPLADKLMQERDAAHAEISELIGMPYEDVLVDEGIVNKYLSRQYLVHILGPQKWAKVVRRSRQPLVENAVNFFAKEHPNWSKDQIAAEIVTILKAEDPLDALKGSSLLGSKASNKLIKRQDIPVPLRALMGEVENGVFKLSQSLASQRAIIHNLRTWREIALNPKYSSLTPRPDLHPVKIPENRRLYGDAAGMYVTPEIYENLVNMPKTISSAWRWMNAIASIRKANLILTPTAFVNATVGNMMYSVLAGGDFLTRPKYAARGWKEAAKALIDYRKNPQNSTILEAMRMGVDGGGFGSNQAGGDINTLANDLLAPILNSKREMTLIDITQQLANTISGMTKKGYKNAGKAYDVIDRIYKIANYVAVRDKLVSKGMDLATAQKTAARRVNQSFPAYDKMSKFGNAVAGGPVGIAAPFGSFFAENLRVVSGIPGRIASGETDLAWRLAAWGMFASALFGAGGYARRELSGISDDEVKAAEASLSDGKKYYRPLTYAMPYRDSQGRPEMWDLTQWVPMAQLWSGSPDDAPWKRVASNLMTGPVEGGFAEDDVQGFLQSVGMARAPQGPQDMLPGEGGIVNTMQKLWDAGAAPKVPLHVYETLRRAEAFGNVRSTEEAFTPGQAAVRMAGFPTMGGVTPGGPYAQGAYKETMAKKAELEQQLRRVARQDPEKALPFLKEAAKRLQGLSSQEKKAQDIKAVVEEIKKLMEKMKERQELIGKGRQ